MGRQLCEGAVVPRAPQRWPWKHSRNIRFSFLPSGRESRLGVKVQRGEKQIAPAHAATLARDKAERTEVASDRPLFGFMRTWPDHEDYSGTACK